MTVKVNVVDLALMSSALPLMVIVYVPAGVAKTVVIDKVDVNVGVPVAVPRVATGQLGLHAGPVTVVLRVMLLEVPWTSVAVTVAVVLFVWMTVALPGLTPKL